MNRLPAPPLHLRRGSSGVFIPALVVPENPAFRIGHPTQLRDRICQGPELSLTLARGLLCLLAFGDIQDDAEETYRAAFAIAQRPSLSQHPALFTIAIYDAVLHVQLGSAAHRFLDRSLRIGTVVRVH